MPTIFDPEESHLWAEPKYLKSPVSVPRKSSTKRVYQQDLFKVFEEQDKIKNFDAIDSTLTPPGYAFQKYDGHVAFYHLETNVLSVPEVTDCVLVDRDLHVVLQGLTFSFNTVVSSRKVLSLYEKKYNAKLLKLYKIRGRTDVQYSARAQRAQIFSSNIIWYSLLRYTSLKTYRLLIKEFPFPSLSLLKKYLMLWNVPNL